MRQACERTTDTNFWLENLKETGSMEDLVADQEISLKEKFKREGVRMWNRFM
jgi:hypothetical protein